MDLGALPMIPVDASGDLEATNSWMLDFMMHGNKRYLSEDNGIDSSKAYSLMTKWKEAIAMTIAVMKVYSPADDIVLKTFQLLLTELDGRMSMDAKR